MDKPYLPKMLKKLHLYLLLLSSLIGFESYSQTYPISVTTQITQPSPIYLSNYADATTINSPIKIQLVLNDLTISNRQVKLKIYFNGNGISFSTNDFVVGARALYLEGGFPLQLTNADLAPYFEYQNLLGLNPNQYAQPLPEGVYNIYVEVYDFATGKKLSKKTGSSTIIFQNEPPFLNLPLNNASIMQQNIQNIIFSWTPRSINISNVEYEFSLVEIWDKYTPIQNAFAYSPPLYTTTTRTTTLQYGINEPQLLPGKKYAWRIKAKAIFGAEEIGVFKNNGYSEVFSFDYETFCTPPLSIATTGVSENQAKITWSGNIDNYEYQVNYREKNADSEWYKLVTPRENLTLSNLKPNATYEYTVGASCEVGKYTHSTINEFTTIAKDEIAFAGCGIEPDPKDLTNKNPLPELFPNDVVTAGDFPIVVLHSTGSNGTFTGYGYVTLPFLEKFRKLIDAADALGGEKINIGQFSRIKITFKNIGVNTDFKLISGEIVASYDASNWDKMLDADKIINDIAGSNGKPIEGKISYEAKDAVLNADGSTTIKGTNGEATTIQKSVYDQVYTDKNGNVVNIPANGNGEPTFIKAAEGGKSVPANTNGVASNGEVTQISSPDVSITFTDAPKGLYAFDELPDNGPQKLKDTYETVPVKGGDVYHVNYKAVSDLNGPDTLIAEAEFKNGKTKDDIVFKTNTGAFVDLKWISATKAEIKIKRTLNFSKESILATVKGAKEKDPKDAAKTIDGKSDVAGKINIWQLTQKPVINITLLSVNGASTPSIDEAKKFLNDVYNKVGIKFDVTIEKVTIGSLPNEIQCGESGVFDVYTNDQNNIIGAIESSPDFKYNDKTYYVLYTGKAGQNGYQGFMPLGGQYAFVFNNNLKTAAHELGHGIFGLKHPFANKSEEGKTDLLMDYDENGTKLSHNDWDIIHSGGWKFYGFQKSSSGAIRINDGIDILGNIISKVDIKEDLTKTKLVGTLSKSVPFLRTGFNEYSNEKLIYKYRAVIKNNKVLYLDEVTQKEMPYQVITTDSGSAYIGELGAACTYNKALLSNWIKPENANTETIINEVSKRISEQKPKWEEIALYKNDPSCGIYNTWEDIKTNDQNCNTAKINGEKENLIKYLSKDYDTDKIEEIVDEINKNCLGTLKELNYDIVIKYIKFISSQKRLFKADVPDKSEIAILRLITAIDYNNYKRFFSDLEVEKNELLRVLIDELDDHSVFFWDGNNYNTFIKALSFIQSQLLINDNDYLIDKLLKTDEKLLKQSINLTREKIADQPDWDTIPGELAFFRTRNVGEYDESTGLITLQEVHSTISNSSGTSSTKFIEIPSPPIDIATVSPLTPIVFHVGDRGTLLEKVNLALDGVSEISKGTYIAPAIFFKYNADKDLDNDVEKGVIATLDVATIYGGIATLTKDVSKAKRIWAMMEVAGAIADITTKNATVSPDVQKVVDIYNGAIGLIGIKNITKGSIVYLSNLPSNIKDAIKNNQGIRNLLIAKYTEWKVAVANLKLTTAEKKLITEQEKVFKALGILDDISHTVSGLTKLDELFTSSKFITFFSKLPKNKPYFTNIEAFKTEFIRLHEACNANSVKKIESFADDFVHFIDNSLSKVKEENAIEFMKEMMQTSDKFKAGGTSLEVIRNPGSYIDNVDDLEDLEDLISSTPAIDGEFRFDILFRAKQNSITYKVFVDTKNYSSVSGIFKELSQIKAYIKEIKSFKEFRIIQQARPGINTGNLKKAFQTAIGKDAKAFFMSNESLFRNSGIDNYTVLEKLCSENKLINHPIMDIIQITK